LKRIFTRRSDARRLALLGIVTGSVVAASAAAQETGGPTPQQLAKDRENPFAQTINLPLAAVTGFGIGPHHDVGEQLPHLPATDHPTPNRAYGRSRDLPVPAQGAFVHARVYDHAGSGGHSL